MAKNTTPLPERNGPARSETTREDSILNAAAALFATRGYAATSIRDIGEKVGLLGGSLYHYIKSKDALFIRVHDDALGRAETAIREGIAGIEDPQMRLETACRVLIAIQLDPQSVTMPLMNDLRAVPETVRAALIARRDTFEALFAQLIEAVPLAPGIDSALYRIVLLSAINNAGNWYRPDGPLSLNEVTDQILAIHGVR